MTDCLKPEVRVIAEALTTFTDELTYSDVNVENAHWIWSQLIEHWQNRSIVTPIEPYIHGGSSTTTDYPGEEFVDAVGEHRWVNPASTDQQYKSFVISNLNDILVRLYDMAELPMWSEKEKEKLTKMGNKIYSIMENHDS